MAKTLVIDKAQQSRVPFLRGILTRSLQQLGLSFEDAYDVASAVRQDLEDTDEITSDELREQVASRLGQSFNKTLVEAYRSFGRSAETIMVRHAKAQLTPFSRSHIRRVLQTCGLTAEQAVAVTGSLHSHLLKKKVTEIESERLRQLIRRYVRRSGGDTIARRYIVWTDFVRSGRPLLLLVGGTAGSGKSTITTELANRLDIVRTVSTDMLREVMRMMIPERLLPVLHRSSFNAWQALPAAAHEYGNAETLLAEGYYSQAQLLSIACEAVIQRAVRERVSLVLEGVHVNATMLQQIPRDESITIVPVMLAVLNRKDLRKRIRGRGTDRPQRRAERYLSHFDEIWRLQETLLSEADQLGVPIVINDEKDATIEQVMAVVLETLAKHFAEEQQTKRTGT